MLAESLSVSTGWLVFVLGMAAAVTMVPTVVGLLRRSMPLARRSPRPVEALAFGRSPKVRRSPRQAIRLHRSVLASAFMAVVASLLVALMMAADALGPVAAPLALLFAGPVLVVALHGRRRSPRS